MLETNTFNRMKFNQKQINNKWPIHKHDNDINTVINKSQHDDGKEKMQVEEVSTPSRDGSDERD